MGGRIKASKVIADNITATTSLTIGGATVSADGAELNLLNGAVAGTSVASTALVLGANKNTDVLALPVSGLKIGAGAGTAVTASAAEINVLTGVTPGTAKASAAAVLGANKNLDTLVLADGGLYLGAAGGTSMAATAAELNAAAKQSSQSTDGIHPLQVAIATFDPSLTAGMRTQGAHGLGVTLPQYAIVVGGFMDVNTVFTSAGGTATVAIHVEAANDIQTAAAVSGAPWSAINRKAITPKANTPESTSVKSTAAREITATVAVQDLTAGKVTVYLYFIAGKASA